MAKRGKKKANRTMEKEHNSTGQAAKIHDHTEVVKAKKMKRKAYERELAKLEIELVKMQGWIKQQGLKVMVIFEGRDSAGSSFSGGNGAFRPQLVQPGRGGARDGLLYGCGIRRLYEHRQRARAGARAFRHHLD
jgi:hypothetical protein